MVKRVTYFLVWFSWKLALTLYNTNIDKYISVCSEIQPLRVASVRNGVVRNGCASVPTIVFVIVEPKPLKL